MKKPKGLWPFTNMILDYIYSKGFIPVKIEVHAPCDPEEPDFIWGELTPYLDLSEGEYMKIDQVAGEYFTDFGMRVCAGGDPSSGGHSFLMPTKRNAELVGKEFIDYFYKEVQKEADINKKNNPNLIN